MEFSGKKASVAFKEAAEYIKKNGWYQGFYYKATGEKNPPCCLWGTINMVVTGQPVVYLQQYIVADMTVLNYQGRAYVEQTFLRTLNAAVSPTAWNDTPGRTKEEVIDVLNKMSEEAKKDESP